MAVEMALAGDAARTECPKGEQAQAGGDGCGGGCLDHGTEERRTLE